MDLQYLGDQIMKKLILVMTLFTFSASTTTFAKDSSVDVALAGISSKKIR